MASFNELMSLITAYLEAEQDYTMHNLRKKEVAKILNKSPNELVNKKYNKDGTVKNVNSELKYKYQDKLSNGIEERRGITRAVSDLDGDKGSGREFEMFSINDIKTKEQARKYIAYMKKKSNSSKPEDVENYKRVRKMLCAKFNIKDTDDLWVQDNEKDPKETSNSLDINVLKEYDKIHNKDGEIKFPLPEGYRLITRHRSSPTSRNVSTFYTGDHGASGQFHKTGRLYFVVSKKNMKAENSWGSGGNLYELLTPVKYVYVDPEGRNSKNAARYNSIEDLVGKPVYIKTTPGANLKFKNLTDGKEITEKELFNIFNIKKGINKVKEKMTNKHNKYVALNRG